MDIDLLSKMVKELILDNDKVVLPGLGCFVAEIVPSTFSDKGYTINPPYRKLSFRAKPDRGDELVGFYASQNEVSREIAERIITDFVAELKSVLHQKKNVVFPNLGRLRATKENTVFFVADENLDIYPAGFGLEPVSLKTHQETKEEVSAAVVGLRSLLDDIASDDIASHVLSASEHAEEALAEDIVPVSEQIDNPPAMTAQPQTQQESEQPAAPGHQQPSEPELELSSEQEPKQEPAFSTESDSEPESDSESESEPERDSELPTGPVAEPCPTSESEFASASESEHEAESIIESDAAPSVDPSVESTVEPTPEPITDPCQKPVHLSGQEQEQEPRQDLDPDPAQAQEKDQDPEPHTEPAAGKPLWKKILLILLILAVTAAVLMSAYMAVAIYAPEWLDALLYTPEELDILNYKH